MRKIKIPKPEIPGGYISRTISKGYLSSIPIAAWTDSFHKPYADDWAEARRKAVEHCRASAITYEGGEVRGEITENREHSEANNKQPGSDDRDSREEDRTSGGDCCVAGPVDRGAQES